jgi:ribosomal-protein-alanine N-acetyltransferase
MKNLISFPELTTENLQLRRVTLDDIEEIFKIRSDESIAAYLDRPICKSIDEAKKFIVKINENFENKETIYWGICRKGEKRLIGTICLWKILMSESKAEIGFELFTEYQGKGIMREAVPRVTDFAFNVLGLNIIEGAVEMGNKRSIMLLERHGFRVSHVYDDNEDMILYELRKD